MTRPTNELSATNRAFLRLVCALVWLVVGPVFFVRGLCRGFRAQDDSGEDLPDPCCAIDPITIHIGGK